MSYNQDKAKSLVDKFKVFKYLSFNECKQCAIMVVDEIIKFSEAHRFSIREDNDYLEQIKDEINNL